MNGWKDTRLVVKPDSSKQGLKHLYSDGKSIRQT
jgi:hypothetical protein